MKKIIVMLTTVGLVLFLGGSWATADKIVVMPVAPACPPQWTPVPQVPGVQYAPNLGQDFFRYQGAFYNFLNGAWLRAPQISGPWVSVSQPPQVFYDIQAPYFKSPPGWAKGKKTGWGADPMPPGHMKKQNGGHLPPGQAKKINK
ncbi:MAG: hypothetical protein WAU47_07235 [Desulfobaccales bacterium]